MSFHKIDFMNSTSTMLDLISKKQKAIGENLANIDTPGYVRKDVDFGKYIGATTNTMETKLSEKLGSSHIVEDREYEEINPANELMEMQKNSILYTMATRRMSNIITEMKTVINVGK